MNRKEISRVKVHTTKKYHRIRVKEPSSRRYIRYRVKKLNGVKAVIGVKRKKGKRGGRTEIQSILVPKRLGKRVVKVWIEKAKKLKA